MKLLSRSEEIILLTILKLKKNAYGVSIREQIFTNLGERWSFASIYAPLDRLVRKEYARRIKGAPSAERGGKSKFFYEVTPEGKNALRELSRAYDRVRKGVPRIVLENGE